jgi:MFS family permease
MKKIRFAVFAGLIFGILDIIPMLWMDIPNRWLAIAGAFCNRFAIGFLIPIVQLPVTGWFRGLIVGFLLSLPDAIITGAIAPIMGFGIVGGVVIGYLTERFEKKQSGN